MKLELTDPPSGEPIDVEDAKLYLRVDHDDEDDIIALMISAARDTAETYTRRQLMPAGYALHLRSWPSGWIELPKPPLLEVDSVVYFDENGDEQTLPELDYDVDDTGIFGKFRVAYLAGFPALDSSKEYPVIINYTAGYDDAEDIPANIRVGMLNILGHYYEHRQSLSVGQSITEIPMAAKWSFEQHQVPFLP